jgi:hypothetical protein
MVGDGVGVAPASDGEGGGDPPPLAGDDGVEDPADGGREAGDDEDGDGPDDDTDPGIGVAPGEVDGDVPPGPGRTIVPKQPAVRAIATLMAKMAPF